MYSERIFQCVRFCFALLIWLIPALFSQPLEASDLDVVTTSRIEVTLSTAKPGSLIDLRQIHPGCAWYVNSPGGVLQLFAIGTLASDDEVHIIVNGSNVLYNTSEFINSNDGITVTTRQIIIHYPGRMHNETNLLYYVRDINLRRSDCGDPIVITSADANISVNFSSNVSRRSECAVTIFSLMEAAPDLHTIAFTRLNTTSTTTSPALIIAGIYQKVFTDDIILFTITSSDARRWERFPILERIVTIIVPHGAVVNGFVNAAYLPLYNRRVHLGDVGIISSRNYPLSTTVDESNITYKLSAIGSMPFIVDIIRAEIQPNSVLSIFSYPPLIIRKRIKGSEISVNNERHRFTANYLILGYYSPNLNGSRFLIRYRCRGSSRSRVLTATLLIIMWICLFCL